MTDLNSRLLTPDDDPFDGWSEQLDRTQLMDSRTGRAVIRSTASSTVWLDRRDNATRPFIGWDGEGVTDPDGLHRYILFGSSSGAQLQSDSLDTLECFASILQTAITNPRAIHCIFAGSYDVNMILKDVPLARLERIRTGEVTYYCGWRIQYRKGKFFRLGYRDITVTLWDVFTFFSSTFVKAVSQYLGEVPELDSIRIGKSQRSNFHDTNLSEIVSYWQLELVLLVKLMNRLRELLIAADIPIRSWHGPGAVAGAVLKRHTIRDHMQTFPEHIQTASQGAYAGGRFEQYGLGHYDGPIYQNDIRSAYPAVIATLPSLRTAQWHEWDGGTIQDYGIYYVTSNLRESPAWQAWADTRGKHPNTTPYPLFWRYRQGNIFYPPYSSGWYWGAEIRLLSDYWPSGSTITKGYILEYDPWIKPFAWVEDMYQQRLEWIAAGIPAQLALKLALNSMYGKMVQQVGWKLLPDGTVRIPEWHQLEWGGYVTATTRARIYAVLMRAGSSVIACETDGIYTTAPIRDLPQTNRLGDWEHTIHGGITYLQSGLYFTLTNGEWKVKCRGYDRGTLNHPDIIRHLRELSEHPETLPLDIPVTRFHTMGNSLGTDRWRRWITSTRQVNVGQGTKRTHQPERCSACKQGVGFPRGIT